MYKNVWYLSWTDTSSAQKTLSKFISVPLEKVPLLKKTISLWPVSRFSSFNIHPFSIEFDVKESKQEVAEVVPLVINGGKSTKCIQFFLVCRYHRDLPHNKRKRPLPIEVSVILVFFVSITKTRLFKYIENFTTKKWKLSDEKLW